MIGESVEFLTEDGTFMEGTIIQLSGNEVVVEDQAGCQWQGRLSQLIFRDGRRAANANGSSNIGIEFAQPGGVQA